MRRIPYAAQWVGLLVIIALSGACGFIVGAVFGMA